MTIKDFIIGLFAIAVAIGISHKIYGETPKVAEVVLTPSNFTILLDEVNALSVNTVMQGITNSDPSKPFYLIINSPGGYVLEGRPLVSYLTSTNRNIVCIAQTAISMAYVTLQACPVRLVTNHSILMTHQIAGGSKGTLNDMKAALTFTQKLADLYDRLMAGRMQLTLEEYRAHINPEWWFVGAQDAIINNAADAEVKVTCTRELEKQFVTYGEGKDAVNVSKCPI